MNTQTRERDIDQLDIRPKEGDHLIDAEEEIDEEREGDCRQEDAEQRSEESADCEAVQPEHADPHHQREIEVFGTEDAGASDQDPDTERVAHGLEMAVGAHHHADGRKQEEIADLGERESVNIDIDTHQDDIEEERHEGTCRDERTSFVDADNGGGSEENGDCPHEVREERIGVHPFCQRGVEGAAHLTVPSLLGSAEKTDAP